MWNDTRIEKIQFAHDERFQPTHKDRGYLLAYVDALKDRLKDAEEYGQEYIERTDPALQCDYWWRYDDNFLDPGERCGTCRRCAMEEVDSLKAELAKARVRT